MTGQKRVAGLVRALENFTGEAALYVLSEAVKYGYDEDAGSTKYVVVSATNALFSGPESATNALFSGPETYIFPATKDGEVIEWLEMDGSFRGGWSHEAALAGLGFTLRSRSGERKAKAKR